MEQLVKERDFTLIDGSDAVGEKEYPSFKNRTIWAYPNPETVRKVDAAAHQQSMSGPVARFFARFKFWRSEEEDECAVPSFLRHQAD